MNNFVQRESPPVGTVELRGHTVPIYSELTLDESADLSEIKGNSVKAMYEQAHVFIRHRLIAPAITELDGNFAPTTDEVLDLEEAMEKLLAPLAVAARQRVLRLAQRINNLEQLQLMEKEAQEALEMIRESIQEVQASGLNN